MFLEKKLRASIHRVDSAGVEERRRYAVRRRVYTVPHPNYVWHIDGNHKIPLIMKGLNVCGGMCTVVYFVNFLKHLEGWRKMTH